MFDKEEFKRLNLERDKIIENEFLLDATWKKMLNYICKDNAIFDGFLEYMKTEMTKEEYLNLSEISNDLSGIHPSLKFVEAYKSLAQKYPKETVEWQINTFIEDADRLVNYFLENEEARVKRLKEWFDNDPDFIKPYL